MVLKARSPAVVIPNKPKMLISGEAGVGKTIFALDFPKPYLIDTESGATRPQYQEKLKKAGGAYFGRDEGAQHFPSVLDEVKQLTISTHEYKTLIIDSFSYLYLMEASQAEESVGSEFGRDKKEANKPTRQLMRWLDKINMNVILICHSKGKWARKGKDLFQEGTTFDGYDKLEYLLDLWIEIIKGGKNFIVRKSRIESLVQESTLPLSFEKFSEIYGAKIIESETTPVEMANEIQIRKITELVTALSIPEEQVGKWFKKVDVDDWSEMSSTQIDSLIETITKKIESLSKETKNG